MAPMYFRDARQRNVILPKIPYGLLLRYRWSYRDYDTWFHKETLASNAAVLRVHIGPWNLRSTPSRMARWSRCHTSGMSDDEKRARFKPLDFFELPAEVRLLIYDYLVVDNGPLLIKKTFADEPPTTSFLPLNWRPLSASKQLLREAVAAFFKSNRFTVEIDLRQYDIVSYHLAHVYHNGLPPVLPLWRVFPTNFAYRRLSHLTVVIGAVSSVRIPRASVDWAGLSDITGLTTLEILFKLPRMRMQGPAGDLEMLHKESPWLLGVLCQVIQNTGPEVELRFGSEGKDPAVDVIALRSLAAQLAPLRGMATRQTEAMLGVVTEEV
ncbi:hypothetical protein NA57DRAFT_79970 [Rhizodiscina lignyota]|uniref:F-box domain-containing protein n=1 Tax=Rhizodiscina lignyota TaxID=1504668 RepID=A0A9P4I6I0_9PEZI|nr:hypothetical protein NA57DRAFT_79970 [Rhizodiscina lignyota]